MNDKTMWAGHPAALAASERPGDRIGPFTIIQQLGEGGFGTVFEAEQEQPVKRRVAIKIIKLGMDTREVLARFDAERQALALMDHPNIARVLDAGTTPNGRPYFVMELVDGEPITTFCNSQLLPIDDRLVLFEQVCAAVQHAHSKGIIHRDLKPSNILVRLQDGTPSAKVIDFGIAKATSGRLTDGTMFTEANMMMGTPQYMSPEQAQSSADIDTRTDIYALGVILYELLTDSTPIDSQSIRGAGVIELLRLIRDVEPPLPSARLSQARLTKAQVANSRKSDPGRLIGALRGELDWIVMKAIDKDRSRRYETANGLAMDIRRHLNGEPVLAAPPSASYRLGKFVRRNKGMVAAGALVAISLLAGIVGFAWQARLAREQEHIAQQRADELKKVSDFQAAMLGQIDPTAIGKSLSDDVREKYAAALAKARLPSAERARLTAAFAMQWQRVNATDAATELIERTILKPAVTAIDRQFHKQPLVDAALRQALATSYSALGLLDRAMPLQQQALATRRRELGDEHPDTLASVESMGALLNAQGKSDEAEPYFRKNLAIRRRKLGSDHPQTLESLADLGMTLDYEGKLDEAEPLAREALEKRRRVLGPDDKMTLSSIASMASVLLDQGKPKLAEPLFREVLERTRRVLGEDDPQTMNAMNDLGALFMQEGRPRDAEPYFRGAWESHRRLQGDEHPDTLQSLGNLGGVLLVEGKFSQAEPVLRDAIDKCTRVLGSDNATTLLAIAALGQVLVEEGRFAEAEHLLASPQSDARKVLGESSPPQFALYMLSLGQARTGLRQFDDAQTALLEANGFFDKSAGNPRGTYRKKCLKALVELYAAWNRAKPGKGYDAQSAEWKKKLDAINAPEGSSAKGPAH
jgi:serine/threonine protein kinase